MLADALCSRARNLPEKVALRIKRGGAYREWTYAEVWKQARSAAACLGAKGVIRGDRVALLADNSPEWVLAYLGIHLAGGVVVPLDVQYTPHELRTILGFAGCRLMLCAQATLPVAQTLQSSTPLRELMSIDGASSLFMARNAPLTSEPPEPPVSPSFARKPCGLPHEGMVSLASAFARTASLDKSEGSAKMPRGLPRVASLASDDLMTVIYTSGTTGDPKGVCLSVGNIESNVQAMVQSGILGQKDTALCILPLHHCYALTTTVLTPLTIGGDITFCASLRGPDILAAIVETGVSVAACVPKVLEGFDRAIFDKVRRAPPGQQRLFRFLATLSRHIRRLTGWNSGRLFFPSIRRMLGRRFRFFVSGGAKLDREVIERLLDLGIRVVEGYGLTETSPVVSFNPIRRLRPGSVGLPVAGVRVKIAGPDAEGVGEVFVQGPNVMQGYDRRPEETAQVLKDGWFHTGDLGFINGDGYLHLTGRIKEVIVMASGKNVYPEDVERCYSASPLVREICVMPVERSDGRVERLRAVIVPAFEELQRRKVPSAHEALRLEITRMSQELPSYMRLTELKLVTNELPRTRLGKLRRAEIRRMAFNELEESASVVLTPEEQALLEAPGAEQLIEHLRSLSGRQGRILPSDHLELDLGLDSLARVELDVMLEQEFGIRIQPNELAQISTVGHLLRRLSGEAREGSAPVRWGEILRQRVAPPLSDLFPRQGHCVERGCVEAARRLAKVVARWALALDIRGLERLPQTDPYLLCPTHASRSDAVLIFLSLPRTHIDRLFFLGAEELFTSSLMRWIARVGRVIPTATTDTVLISLRRAAEALQMGYSVCIFPEGAVSRDGWLQRPRPGAGILACELSVPLVPVLMRGTFDLFSYAHPGFHFRSVGVTFGTPIAPPIKAGTDTADYVALMMAWQEAVIRLREDDDASGSLTAGRSPRVPKE